MNENMVYGFQVENLDISNFLSVPLGANSTIRYVNSCTTKKKSDLSKVQFCFEETTGQNCEKNFFCGIRTLALCKKSQWLNTNVAPAAE